MPAGGAEEALPRYASPRVEHREALQAEIVQRDAHRWGEARRTLECDLDPESPTAPAQNRWSDMAGTVILICGGSRSKKVRTNCSRQTKLARSERAAYASGIPPRRQCFPSEAAPTSAGDNPDSTIVSSRPASVSDALAGPGRSPAGRPLVEVPFRRATGTPRYEAVERRTCRIVR
jgi:hypothetical protein